MALFPGLPGWAGTRKVKPICILLKQETVSGSCISWAICKPAPHSRQITTPAPHHSVFYRLDVLPAAQPTVSKHWRRMLAIGPKLEVHGKLVRERLSLEASMHSDRQKNWKHNASGHVYWTSRSLKTNAQNRLTFSSEHVRLVFPTHSPSRWTSLCRDSSSVCTSASEACVDQNRKSAVTFAADYQ